MLRAKGCAQDDELAKACAKAAREYTGVEKRVRERLRYYKDDATMRDLMEYLLHG